eukprot:6194791-Pleurochrysis_carterae.AAC.1
MVPTASRVLTLRPVRMDASDKREIRARSGIVSQQDTVLRRTTAIKCMRTLAWLGRCARLLCASALGTDGGENGSDNLAQAELAHWPVVAVKLGAEGLDQAGRDSVERAERREQLLVEQRRGGGRCDALEEPRRVAARLNAVDNDGARGSVRVVRAGKHGALNLFDGGGLAGLFRLGRDGEAHADGGVLREDVGLELALQVDETQVVIWRELERVLGVEGEADVRRGVLARVALEVDGLKPIGRLHQVADPNLQGQELHTLVMLL